MQRFLMSLLLAGLVAGGALGDPKPVGNEPLTAEAMRAELFGIQMSGIVVQTGQRWSECIEPGGRTLYEFEGYRSEGLLEVTDKAEACFTYPGSGTSCFRGQRAPKGYMFRPVGGGAAFHANKIERGVKKCITSDLVG